MATLQQYTTYTNTQQTDDMTTVSGAYGVGVPPVPIPNTEVKTHCGNNTRTTRSRQDSTAPDSITQKTHISPPTQNDGGLLCFNKAQYLILADRGTRYGTSTGCAARGSTAALVSEHGSS